MDAKVAFILDWKSGKYLVSDLCAQYGISRKTGYKWINRFMDEGPDGLFERSHAPRESPHRTPVAVEQAIVDLRVVHPSWGAKKLIWKPHRSAQHEGNLQAKLVGVGLTEKLGCGAQWKRI